MISSLPEPVARGDVERLADREQADGDHHDVDAVEQLRDAEGEARLAGLQVDADQAEREADEQAGEAARPADEPSTADTVVNASTISAK